MSSPAHTLTEVTPGFGAPLCRDGWVVRPARDRAEVAHLVALRAQAFRGDARTDADPFDARFQHLWIGRQDGPALATLRLRLHGDGASVLGGYTAQYHDLTPLAALPGAAMELGRLCRRPGADHPDLMRLVWAGIARMADAAGAVRLFGCASFRGADPVAHTPALALLAARHLGPEGLRPRPLARESVAFASLRPMGPVSALVLPPLLRGYVALGGWVGGHLVIDRDLDTGHVFTCLDVAAIPDSRKRLLRAMAG